MKTAPNRRGARFWLGGASIWLITGSIAFAFMINLCDWIYDCGCRSLWNGAAEMCNIHDAGTPDCPWCSTGWLGAYLPPAMVLLAQGFIAFWPSSMPWWLRTVTALLAFPVVGGVLGIAFGIATGYWL